MQEVMERIVFMLFALMTSLNVMSQEFMGISLNQSVANFEKELFGRGYSKVKEYDDRTLYRGDADYVYILKGEMDNEKVYCVISSVPVVRRKSDAVAVKDNKNKWGFVDESGSVKIPCTWRYAWSFNEGLAAVQDTDKKWGFIDKNGKVVIPCKWCNPDYIGFSFCEGLVNVKDENGKWGFIDRTGKLVIPCKWKWAYDFKNGRAKVKDERDREIYIDKTGKVVK